MLFIRPLLTGIIFSASALMVSAATPTKSATQLVYFGTFDLKGDKSGIFSSRFDASTGKLSAAQKEATLDDPSWVTVNRAGTTLYCGSVVPEGDKSQGFVVSFKIDGNSGHLTETSRQPNGTESSCHLALSKDESTLFAANYGNGFIASFPIQNGVIQPVASRIQHKGTGPDKNRQDAAHVHQASPSPDGKFVFAPDLGTDHIVAYRISDDSTLVPVPENNTTTPGGHGPRHLTFSPDGRFAYEITEMVATVRTHRYDAKTGKLSLVQDISNVPEDFKGEQAGAEIVIHPNGRFLYASNRQTHESIAVYSIDQETGKLTRIQFFQKGVKHPRDLAFDPSGKWLLYTNVFADNVAVAAVDPDNGMIGEVASTLAIPHVSCVAFVRK